MQKLLTSIHLRYALAIVISAALMIWQSMDAVRNGADLYSQALFWSASVTAGWLQMIVIARGVRSTFGADRHPGWVLLAGSALVGAAPLTFQVRWMMQTIVAPDSGLPAPWVTYLNVTTICIVFGLIQYLLVERWPLFEPKPSGYRKRTPDDLTPPMPTEMDTASIHTAPFVDLLSRRPEGLKGTIRYLRMQDHYLLVCTEVGNGMVLHRMGDAVSELAQSDGLQVHKSWWVAHEAVKEVRRHNRARSIVTVDGTEIPIGRSFENSLRDAGWI